MLMPTFRRKIDSKRETQASARADIHEPGAAKLHRAKAGRRMQRRIFAASWQSPLTNSHRHASLYSLPVYRELPR